MCRQRILVTFPESEWWAQFKARSLSDLRLIYCAGGKSGPFFPDFSLHSSTMRLEIVKNCPRSPPRLATIAQVRQAPRQNATSAATDQTEQEQ